MVRFLVVYETPPDPAAFDAHYRDVHIPLTKELPGLRRYTISRNTSVVPGGEPFYLVAELDWDDEDALEAAFASLRAKPLPETSPAGHRRHPEHDLRSCRCLIGSRRETRDLCNESRRRPSTGRALRRPRPTAYLRESSLMDHGSMWSIRRCESNHGSRPRVARTISADSVSTASTTR